MPSAGTFVLTNCRVLVGGADLSGDTNEATISGKKVDKDVTNYNSGGWTEHLGGLGTATIAVKGFTEAGSLSLPDDNGWANLGLLGGVTLAPQGAASGALAYFTNVLESDFAAIQGKVGDVAGFSYSLISDWKLVRGLIGLPPAQIVTATGTGTPMQLGAVAAGQSIYADLHVISVAGTTPSLTVAIQSATTSGFGSPTTRLTFNAATAIGGQIMKAAGPITDTWWAVQYTVSGTTPSFLASVAFGIA
jgi:hypothetical protein